MEETRVLVVDDEREFLENVSKRLSNRGFLVDTALDGERALGKIAGNIYDAIIMDLMMPGIDGLETLQRALKKKKSLQIILLTGQASIKTGVEAMRRGALDFMEKPADLNVLEQKIRDGKARRQQLDEQGREEAVIEALKKYGW